MHDAQEIHVLDHKIRLLQPANGFRTSLDTVILAAACTAQAGDRVLDLGCGVGGAGLCVTWRVPEIHLTGIDITPEFIALAQKNAVLNAMSDGTNFTVQDVADLAKHQDNHKPIYDHVICNPPYLDAGTYTPSPLMQKAVALGNTDGELQVWIDAAFYQLKNAGCLTMIHRADYLDKIIIALGSRFGGVEIIPLWPRQDEAAKRVIVRAIKNSKKPLTLHAGIVLHMKNGDYTPQAQDILRIGKAIDIAD